MISMSRNPTSVLVVVAHPDDAEFMCGATLAKYAAAGSKVAILVLTNGDKWHIDDKIVDSERIAAQREQEAKRSLAIIRGHSIQFLGFEDGNLRADICTEALIRSVRSIGPDIIITHSGLEKHPDHHQTHMAISRICNKRGEPMPLENPRWCSDIRICHPLKALYFQATLEELTLSDVFFVELTRDLIQTKIEAILAHQSQIKNPDRLRTQIIKQASLIGQFAGCEYAEAFRLSPDFCQDQNKVVQFLPLL